VSGPSGGGHFQAFSNGVLRKGAGLLSSSFFFREQEPLPRTEKGDRKVVLDADQGKGTTRMDIGHVMRKGNPRSLIAEGNYSLGMKAARVGND
jgi:hypothetical protein